MQTPCPSNSPSGRACQSPRHHAGPHHCCYPGGTETWQDKDNAWKGKYNEASVPRGNKLQPGEQIRAILGKKRLVFSGDVITLQKHGGRYRCLVTDAWDDISGASRHLRRHLLATILERL